MKIVLVHGDNKPKIQDRVTQIVEGVKKKGWKIEHIDKNVSLAEVFTSNTLLPETKLCVLEGVNNLSKENINWLKDNFESIEGSLLLVHNGEAPKRNLQSIKKNIVEEQLSLPKKLFIFLESFRPGNAKTALTLFHELIETTKVEFIIAMISRQLRDLLRIKIDVASHGIPEWRLNKLKQQAGNYSNSMLNELIADISKADYDAKSGGVDLVTSIDLIIMRKLK